MNKVRIKRSSRVKFGLGWKRMKKKKVSKDFSQECSKRVDDNGKALCSEPCSIWFHIQCIKVPECVYDYMQSSGDDGGFTWHCNDCRNCGN